MNRMKKDLWILKTGGKMFRCNICNSTEFQEKLVNKVFTIDNEIVLVEHIPAKVCSNCGEEIFSRDTLANVQKVIYGKPKSFINAKKFEYV
jgi:HTH-type transcriptional regulator / antitoxin MqsA